MSWKLVQAIIVLPGMVLVFIPMLIVYLASGTGFAHRLSGPSEITLWLGVAVGCAAYLCKKHATAPRGVYEKHIQELQDIIIGRGQYKGALQRSESR